MAQFITIKAFSWKLRCTHFELYLPCNQQQETWYFATTRQAIAPVEILVAIYEQDECFGQKRNWTRNVIDIPNQQRCANCPFARRLDIPESRRKFRRANSMWRPRVSSAYLSKHLILRGELFCSFYSSFAKLPLRR